MAAPATFQITDLSSHRLEGFVFLEFGQNWSLMGNLPVLFIKENCHGPSPSDCRLFQLFIHQYTG
jgi:hypothetical protein